MLKIRIRSERTLKNRIIDKSKHHNKLTREQFNMYPDVFKMNTRFNLSQVDLTKNSIC